MAASDGVWVHYVEYHDIRVLGIWRTEQEAYAALDDKREGVAFVRFGDHVETAVRDYYRDQPADDELPQLEDDLC